MKNNNFLKDFMYIIVILLVNIFIYILNININLPIIEFFNFVIINFILIFLNMYKNKKEIKNFVIGIIIVVLFFIAQLLPSFLSYILIDFKYKFVSASSLEILKDYLEYTMLLVSVFNILIVICFSLFYYKDVLKDLSDIFTSLKKFALFIGKLIMYTIIMYFIIFFTNIILVILFPDLINSGVTSENQLMIEEMITNLNVGIMFLSIVITGPLIEELVFRYAMIKKIFGSFNKYAAAFIATIFFVLIHLLSSDIDSFRVFIFLFLGYLPASLTLNFVYAKEENILYSLLLHMFNNFFAFIMIYLSTFI